MAFHTRNDVPVTEQKDRMDTQFHNLRIQGLVSVTKSIGDGN